ncbi:MAG: FimB/Mfa2 family fimbrial subunit, partial [Bacteroidales bacterium]|nr:FimB/Mfa2 family fimbrial subunit [Bacteroidales bacterium]
GAIGYADLSTARFMVDNGRLGIRRSDNGRPVVDIPLTKYLVQMGSEAYGMAAQEFLDRESAWTMFFFLTPSGYWIETRIIVNDWVVRINDADF